MTAWTALSTLSVQHLGLEWHSYGKSVCAVVVSEALIRRRTPGNEIISMTEQKLDDGTCSRVETERLVLQKTSQMVRYICTRASPPAHRSTAAATWRTRTVADAEIAGHARHSTQIWWVLNRQTDERHARSISATCKKPATITAITFNLFLVFVTKLNVNFDDKHILFFTNGTNQGAQ